MSEPRLYFEVVIYQFYEAYLVFLYKKTIDIHSSLNAFKLDYLELSSTTFILIYYISDVRNLRKVTYTLYSLNFLLIYE